MKIRNISLVLLMSFFLAGFAQKNIAKIGFIGSGGINTGVQYERSVSERISIAGQLGYATIFDVWSGQNTNGIGIYMEGRYYFSKNKDLMEGWHAGIYFNYMDTDNSSRSTPYDQKNISGGIVGGYQVVFKSHITLDTLLGAGYLNSDGEFSSDTGIYPLLGLNLGYNF